MAVTKSKLDKLLNQVRRIEAHRTAGAEKEIRKTYKALLKDLKQFVGYEYAELAEEGKLTYQILQQKGEFARFLEEVEKKVNGITPSVSKEITTLVNDTYKLSYNGMISAVKKSTTSTQLKKELAGITAATPQTIKRAVENPISGLTLKDTLEKNRVQIIYDIKRNIGVGLANGDRIETMAKRIAQCLDGDYNKSIRIARTESHRIIEGGFFDGAKEIDDTLKQGVSGQRMVKTWKTMKDERVRTKKADHVIMEGQTVLADDLFILSDGNETEAPGQSGIAAQDINCRCYASYDLVDYSEYKTGDKFAPENYDYAVENANEFDRLHKQMNVTPDEEEIIRKGYTGTWTSKDINDYLRSGKSIDSMPERERKVYDSLMSAISKNTLSKNAILDRYTSNGYIDKVFGENNFIATFGGIVNNQSEASNWAAKFLEKNIGTEITEKSFVSTSASPDLNAFKEYPIKLKLYTKNGTHAYVTGNKYESEIILPPDTKYILRGAKAKGVKIDNDFDWEDELGDIPDEIEGYVLELLCEVVKK